MIEVTGTIAPSCNGTYTTGPRYNDQPTWHDIGSTYHIWWDLANVTWTISDEIGGGQEPGDVWWNRVDPDFVGLYTHDGMAVEDATVARA